MDGLFLEWRNDFWFVINSGDFSPISPNFSITKIKWHLQRIIRPTKGCVFWNFVLATYANRHNKFDAYSTFTDMDYLNQAVLNIYLVYPVYHFEKFIDEKTGRLYGDALKEWKAFSLFKSSDWFWINSAQHKHIVFSLFPLLSLVSLSLFPLRLKAI